MHHTVAHTEKATSVRVQSLRDDQMVQLLAITNTMSVALCIHPVRGRSVRKVPQSAMEQIGRAASRS